MYLVLYRNSIPCSHMGFADGGNSPPQRPWLNYESVVSAPRFGCSGPGRLTHYATAVASRRPRLGVG
jgi:hypothetical protein